MPLSKIVDIDEKGQQMLANAEILIVILIFGLIVFLLWEAVVISPTPAPPPIPGTASPPPYRLPVLPKSATVLLGLGFGVAMGLVGYEFLFWILSFAAGGTLTSEWGIFLAWFISLIGSILIGLLAYYAGRLPDIPTGEKGVILFFGGRISESYGWFPWKRLFPEGENWAIPLIMGTRSVNMKARPLIRKPNPADDVIVVDALAPVLAPVAPPVPAAAPAAGAPAPAPIAPAPQQVFLAEVQAEIAVRIQVFDPYIFLSVDDAEGILFSFIADTVRAFIYSQKKRDMFALPNIKKRLRDHLERTLDMIAKPMGLDFVKLAVTKIVLPKEVIKAATQIPIEAAERAAQVYQAQTLARITETLKLAIPNLGARELKNMALQAANLATTTVTSFEGNAIPVVNPRNNP